MFKGDKVIVLSTNLFQSGKCKNQVGTVIDTKTEKGKCYYLVSFKKLDVKYYFEENDLELIEEGD